MSGSFPGLGHMFEPGVWTVNSAIVLPQSFSTGLRYFLNRQIYLENMVLVRDFQMLKPNTVDFQYTKLIIAISNLIKAHPTDGLKANWETKKIKVVKVRTTKEVPWTVQHKIQTTRTFPYHKHKVSFLSIEVQSSLIKT